METFYTAYTKQVQNETHYFVKKFMAFPEFKDIPPVLENYGMHIDFDKACAIAGLTDVSIKEQLLSELETNMPQAKLIELNPGFKTKVIGH